MLTLTIRNSAARLVTEVEAHGLKPMLRVGVRSTIAIGFAMILFCLKITKFPKGFAACRFLRVERNSMVPSTRFLTF